MTALHDSDFQQVIGFLGRLYALGDGCSFPERLVREVPALVACDHCSWNDIAPSVPRATVVEYPNLDDIESRSAVFSELMLEHPGIVHSLITGDPRPFVLSDALSSDELHRTRLYQLLFKGMGFEDQLGMLLASPAGRICGLSIARGDRGFNPRDREVMATIRPHIGQAHANAEALSRARRRRVGEDTGSSRVALMETDRVGRVKRGLDRAERLLGCYFRHEKKGTCCGLPDALLRWLRQGGQAPLTLRRENRRLITRFFPDPLRGGAAGLLLFEERLEPAVGRGLRAKGLTRREVEVLLELEKGLTNEEAAAVLFISPKTVKKHLENVYAKLGVKNRTSALYWLRREAAGGGG